MVKYSLKKMINKYPYFMNKETDSNNYKVTKVYDYPFQYLYNDLYKVYESFHLNKKIYIYKEQTQPYEYNIIFHSHHPYIKNVTIYKNNNIIYREYRDITEYEETATIPFDFTYTCGFAKTDINKLKVYKCLECGTLYFSDRLPVTCTNVDNNGNICEGNQYQIMKLFQCTKNDQIYYGADMMEVINTNNSRYNEPTYSDFKCTGTFTEINAYRCPNCGEIWFNKDFTSFHCTCEDQNENSTLRKRGNTNTESENTILFDNELTPPLYYSDNVTMYDNALDYTTEGQIYSRELTVIIKNNENTPLENTPVNITYDTDYNESDYEYTYNETTTDNGLIVFSNIRNGRHIIEFTYNDNNYSIPIDVHSDTVGVDVNFNEQTNLRLRKGGADNNYTLEYYDETYYNPIDYEDELDYDVEMPIIPQDQFHIEIETWDEYLISKGFPENDTVEMDSTKKIIPSIYDHDYSLDSFGALNNIPRKTYIPVENYEDYDFTEPPYNDRLTEDDYHYMQRIKEYISRLYVTPPPCLELWKIYGLESTLINRERYLIKVFDVEKHNNEYNSNEDLVDNCWTPELWEHKDQFCDGSTLQGEFFYAVPNTIRPYPYDSVRIDFMLINGLAEKLDNPFSVKIERIGYYVDDNTNTTYMSNTLVLEEKWENDYYTIPSRKIYTNRSNVFRFTGYNYNDEELGSIRIVINTRKCDDADWFVDTTITPSASNKAKYTYGKIKTNPYGSLKEALKNLKGIDDCICLKGNVSITDPSEYNVTKSCTIIGNNNPIITSTDNDKRFFELEGNNLNFKLVNVQLSTSNIDAPLKNHSWTNTTDKITDKSWVIINGGTVRIHTDLDKMEYYRYDTVSATFTLTKSDYETVIPNAKLEVYYKGELISDSNFKTNSNGSATITFDISEEEVGSYPLVVKNISDIYFESEFITYVPVTRTGKTITDSMPLQVCVTDESVQSVGAYLVHVDGAEISDITQDPNNRIGNCQSLTATVNGNCTTFSNPINIPGRFVINIKDCSTGVIVDEFIIESTMDFDDFISALNNSNDGLHKLISNVDITENSDITYEEVSLTTGNTLKVLNGVVIDVKLVEEGDLSRIVLERFSVGDRLEETVLNYSDMESLSKAIKQLSVNTTISSNDYGVLDFTRVGQFW